MRHLALMFGVSDPTVLLWVKEGLPVENVEPGAQFRPLFNAIDAVRWWTVNKAESTDRLKSKLSVNVEALRDSIDGRAAVGELFAVQSELIEIDADLKSSDRRLLQYGVDRIKLKTPEMQIVDMLDDNQSRTITLRLGTLKMRMDLASKLLAKKLPDFKPAEYAPGSSVTPDDTAALIRQFMKRADAADGAFIEHERIAPIEASD